MSETDKNLGEYFDALYEETEDVNESQKRFDEALKHGFIATDKDCKQIYDKNDNKPDQPTGPETPNTNNLIEPSNQNVQNSKLNENIELMIKILMKIMETRKKLILKKFKKRKNDNDNIRSKIKNNLFKFAFACLNDLIYQQYGGYQKMLFRKLEYKDIRKRIYIKELLQKKFYEIILDNNITPKYSVVDLELNKKHLKKLDLTDNSNVSNFLNLTMKVIYNNYFLNKKHEKNYFLNKKQDIIYFDDFIQKLKTHNEDEYYIEKFKKVAKENFISYYFNEKKKIPIKKKKIKFICKK